MTPAQCSAPDTLQGIGAWRDCNRNPHDPDCVAHGTPLAGANRNCQEVFEETRLACLAVSGCTDGATACEEECRQQGQIAFDTCVPPAGTWFNAAWRKSSIPDALANVFTVTNYRNNVLQVF